MSDAHHFGAVGDGTTDDTAAILHAVAKSDGLLRLPRGDYLLSRTVEIDPGRYGRLAIEGSGGSARLVMGGPGPAIRIIGAHGGTADPKDFKPEVWASQRMPMLSNIEIVGQHPEADGVEIIGTMQATLTGVLIRRVRHGVRLTKRNRNVLITGCHIYHNTGVGLFIDACNLHQINITACHISYNRLGGIRVEGSEVRNLQITGNDIEYNNHASHGTPPEPTGEIVIDTTAPGASVRELTIASNTLQATYSPGGANVRIVAPRDRGTWAPGMGSITGNLIGNQEINLHLVGCRGLAVTGNFIYSAARRNLLAEDCASLAIQGNSFGHNPDDSGLEWATGIRLERCEDAILSGVEISDALAGTHTHKHLPALDRAALLELIACRRVSVTACHILNGAPAGVELADCNHVQLHACQILETRDANRMETPVRWKGPGAGNRMTGNTLSGKIEIDPAAGVEDDGTMTA